MAPLPILHLTLLPLIIYLITCSTTAIDPTQGFTQVRLSNSNFQIQRPYDVPVDQRYSFTNGVHKFSVYSTDKPFMAGSDTAPRTEIRVTGYDYESGVWQFEGYGYVPSGSTGVCIMQVFGASPTSTTTQLRIYNGDLSYYRTSIVPNIYNRWFKVNVIHDVGASNVKVYIDGELKYNTGGRGPATHYFKFGVYMQDNPSNYMESRWRDIKIFRK